MNRRFAMPSCDGLKRIEVIQVPRIFVVSHQRHQALEIEHEVDALVENRERLKRALKLERKAARFGVALGGALTELDQTQHLARQHVADAGDGAAGAAIDKAVEHLGVDPDHERDVVRTPGNMLRGIAQRLRAAELLEADQMGKLFAQFEEQLGSCLEAVIRAIVDDRRQVDRRLEHASEMAALGRRGRAARKHARNDHEAPRALFLRVTRERRGLNGVLRACADDDREPSLRQTFDALHSLFDRKQRPVAHRAAIDQPRHSGADKMLSHLHESVEVGPPVGAAGRHERRDRSGKDLRRHLGAP